MTCFSDSKLTGLTAHLADLAMEGRLALAFSGGLDSRFLAHMAALAGVRPLLLHAQGPHIAERESRFARQWAKAHGMEFRDLAFDPLLTPEVAANGRMRCYHCKRALFTLLKHSAGGLKLCDGTQASDNDAYRPGLAALTELGVISPLAHAGLSKPEIRRLATKTGMDYAQQRALPCLLTRFAYQLRPDHASLAALDKAEERIENLLCQATESGRDNPAPDFRLRRLSPDILELHLTSPAAPDEQSDTVPPALRLALEEAVRETMGRPLAAIRFMPTLSGFFDRKEQEMPA